MIAVDGLGYAIFAGIFLALGGLVGWISGWLLSKWFTVRMTPLIVVFSGALGWAVGTYVSFIGFSYHSEWYDGEQVSREVGGLADHFILIAFVCSIAFVIIVKAIAYACRKTTQHR